MMIRTKCLFLIGAGTYFIIITDFKLNRLFGFLTCIIGKASLLCQKRKYTGYWIEDSVGWYPTDTWQKIDGVWYYFDASGYMVTNQYIDGYWLGADGVCY